MNRPHSGFTGLPGGYDKRGKRGTKAPASHPADTATAGLIAMRIYFGHCKKSVTGAGRDEPCDECSWLRRVAAANLLLPRNLSAFDDRADEPYLSIGLCNFSYLLMPLQIRTSARAIPIAGVLGTEEVPSTESRLFIALP